MSQDPYDPKSIPPPPPEERRIDWVELEGGVRIDAAKLVCPTCETLDLGTDIDTSGGTTLVATCTKGHSWEFFPEDSLA